jgi:hypothetical protein
MSGGFSVTISGLETCMQAFAKQAGQFGGISDSVSGSTGAGSAFGSLSVSGQLNSVTSQLGQAGVRQFGSASTFLSATERALDAARESYVKADGAVKSNAKNV